MEKIQLALNVPYAEKDKAKSLGARWSVPQRVWYVPYGVDINLFKAWWPEQLKQAAGLAKPPKAKAPVKKSKWAPRPGSPEALRQQKEPKVFTGPEEVPVDTSDKLPWEE